MKARKGYIIIGTLYDDLHSQNANIRIKFYVKQTVNACSM